MTYSSAIFAEPRPDETLEAAQERKVRLLLDRLDLEARPAPARDRLRLGRPRRDRGARLRRARHRPHLVGRAEGLCRRAARPGRARRRVDDPRSPTIATSRARSTRSPASRWSRRSAQEYWPAYLQSIARVLKPGGRAALQLISIRDDLFERYAANADFIQTYIFPGGMLIGEARFRAPRRGAPASNGGTATATASIMPRR